MTSNRMLSLNEIENDFAVEELESRMEMQMLGIGADPGIIIDQTGTSIIIISTPGTIIII